MIKKNDETGKDDSKKPSFKKFSELKSKGDDESQSSVLPTGDDKLPGNPNLPKENGKFQKGASTKSIRPMADTANYDKDEINNDITTEEVKFYGKVARFPKKTKASKAYNFLENVKISKNSTWYIMVEKTDNELQMIKYNYKKGVDLSKFVNELKTYYSKKYSSNQKVVKLIESIEIDGTDKYSMIKNIPLIDIDGRKMIGLITEDLIKLLSK